MKTLEEFNLQRRQEWGSLFNLEKPHANGLECPKCKKELWDSDPMKTLTSIPPQKNVHCPDCGYIGYRLA